MLAYQVCNRLLDPETNEHCEFDGDVQLRWRENTLRWRESSPAAYQVWDCPGCGTVRLFQAVS